MTKHTQGVWKANGNGVHVGASCVATTHAEFAEKRHADALLISAAPDLLEALKVIMAGIAGSQREPHWEAARAAIAKATGGNE